MKRALFIGVVALAVGIVAGALGTKTLNAQPEPFKRTVLLKTDLKGLEGKEAVVVLVELAPGASSGKHYHPGHEVNYVLEGSGILELEGTPPVTLKPGVTNHIQVKQVHDVKNTSTADPLKLVAFFIAEKGQPLAVPVK
ncbi:MAG: cupin domain-containing protein [Candidatus Methylomirabilis sp.]